MDRKSDLHATSWISSQAAARSSDYAARGRKHQHLGTDQVVDAWIGAFRSMASNVRDQKMRAIEEDLKAELLLRGIEPPYDMVREAFELFIAEADRAIAEMRKR